MPVVNVETPKKETVPKSESVSIATKLNPMKILGLAHGKIIFINLCNDENPILFPKSIRLADWFINDALDNKNT